MRAVNLLPEERRDQEGASQYLSPTWILGVGAGLLVLASVFVGLMYSNANSDVSKKRETLASLQQQAAEAQARQVVSSAPTVSQTQSQLAAFNAAANARISWDTLLGDVARVLPAGSWLSSLSLQGASTAVDPTTGVPAVGATGFTVSGFALSNNIVAQVMRRLELVPMLSGITLARSQRSDVGANKAYQFTMSASVVVNGES